MYSNNIPITNCFLVVKTDGSNKGQDERKEEESKEKDKGDPAKFLKDKLSNITAQLQGQSSVRDTVKICWQLVTLDDDDSQIIDKSLVLTPC